MVESQPSKLLVAGSIPVSRSRVLQWQRVVKGEAEDVRRNANAAGEGEAAKRCGVLERKKADVAQLVEHSLGKGEVIGSIPIISSRNLK